MFIEMCAMEFSSSVGATSDTGRSYGAWGTIFDNDYKHAAPLALKLLKIGITNYEQTTGRRSLCYDRAALESGKENKPANNALDMTAAMGIELVAEEQYREL